MNVVDCVLTSVFRKDVPVVPTSGLPEIGLDPSSRLCTIRDSLLHGLCDYFHFIDFVERMNQDMNVVLHEDVGEDNEVMLLGGFVNSVGKGLADAVVGEVLPSAVGGSCVEMRVARCIAKLSFGLA